MTKQSVTVNNQTGLHLRPAGIVCRTAMLYKSHISLIFGTTTVNAKSVLSVLGAGVKAGDVIEVSCEGEDENEALEAMVNLFENGLG